jgi:hypothetical protein
MPKTKNYSVRFDQELWDMVNPESAQKWIDTLEKLFKGQEKPPKVSVTQLAPILAAKANDIENTTQKDKRAKIAPKEALDESGKSWGGRVAKMISEGADAYKALKVKMDAIKAECPLELKGFDRLEWIENKKKERGL